MASLLKRLVAAPIRPLIRTLASNSTERTLAETDSQTHPTLPPDFDAADVATYRAVQQLTMTSAERVWALTNAVKYVVSSRLPGAIVECGVWRGGSMVAVARTLLELGETGYDLYLFDTFEGMSPPTERDVMYTGAAASDILAAQSRESRVWGYAPLEDVKGALYGVGYRRDRIHFVKGKVEDTIPDYSPERIALLRLDTDWYESTRHELVHLFPRLVRGGVLIIDDYGHWRGARQAVDEYLEANRISLLLNRIDYTARIAVKL